MLKTKNWRCRGCLGVVYRVGEDHFNCHGRFRHEVNVEKTMKWRGHPVANADTDGVSGLDSAFHVRPCNYALYDGDVYYAEEGV